MNVRCVCKETRAAGVGGEHAEVSESSRGTHPKIHVPFGGPAVIKEGHEGGGGAGEPIHQSQQEDVIPVMVTIVILKIEVIALRSTLKISAAGDAEPRS